MRGRRPFLLGLVAAALALALAAPALADPPPTTTTADTGGIQVQTAQPVVAQVAGAHLVRRAAKKPAKGRGGHAVVPAATVATLPFTGAQPGRFAGLGLLLIAAGALLRRGVAVRVPTR